MSVVLNVDAEWIKSKEFSSGLERPGLDRLGLRHGRGQPDLPGHRHRSWPAWPCGDRGRARGLGKLSKAATGLPLLLIAILLVAIWAMTTKPS